MVDIYNTYKYKNRSSTRKNAKMSVSINAGGALVLVIFVALCLTIFGLLSFVTSFADKKLTNKNLLSVSQYYSADTAAEVILSQIYSSLYEQTFSHDVKVLSSGMVEKVLSDISGAAVSEKTPGMLALSYSVPINDMQAIQCEAIFFMDEKTGALEYDIQKWQTVITGEMVYEDGSLNVWIGDDK